MFTFQTTIGLHDTDAAGRLFFANQFRLAHQAYEAFLASLGFPIGPMLKKGRLALPIVRAEADYKQPLCTGDQLEINVRPTRVGTTSFSILCRLISAGQTVGHVTTVHVAVDARRGGKQNLPAALRKALLQASASK